MPRPLQDRAVKIVFLRRVFFLIVLLIVYGSLYPWRFEYRHVHGGAVWFLLSRWDTLTNGYLIRDIFVNLVLYCPLGLTAWFAWQRPNELAWAGIARVVALGFALSVCIELAQVFVPGRQASMVDVCCNCAGTLLGAGAAVLLARFTHGKIRDTRAALLPGLWALWLLFPFLLHTRPVLDIAGDVFSRYATFPEISILWFLGVWYAMGLAMRSAGVRRPLVWLSLSLAVVGAQAFSRFHLPLASEVTGAAAGVVLFTLRPAAAKIPRAEAWGFLALVLAGSLGHLRFTGAPNAFVLKPFQSMIRADGLTGLQMILSQLLVWGAGTWMLMTSGESGLRSILVVAGAVVLLQLALIFVAGAAPGVTAPLLALIAGFLLDAVAGTTDGKAR